MTSVCLYFKVHQPGRLKRYTANDIGNEHCYDDGLANKAAIDAVSEACYLPTNALLSSLLKENKNFRINFSFSGLVLELLNKYRPDVLHSFQRLVTNENVEILAETYNHSLSSLHSTSEFKEQLKTHSDAIWTYFKKRPTVFRNTELIHSNKIAEKIFSWGYKGILCEGVESILNGRSPNHLYSVPGSPHAKLLLRNSRLSDDIAFRFDDPAWSEHPLTAEKFASWVHSHPGDTEVINLFMDYETFGLHKAPETGIFNFLRDLPAAVLSQTDFQFATSSQAIDSLAPIDNYDVSQAISWEDRQEAACVWTKNVMQHNTLKKIYSMERMVKESNCERFLSTWRRLQSADNFYYMNKDVGEVKPKYKNPFSSADEAFSNYTNILVDFEISVISKGLKKSGQQKLARSRQTTIY